MNRKIPITKPYFDEEEIKKVQQCLDSGWVTQGPMTEEFERLFQEEHCAKNAIAVSSCTAALHLAMLALGIGAGDEVIVPAYTWVTSAHCVEYTGAKVIFAEIEKETFNIDPAFLESCITPNTKAIIVVHLFGYAAKMDEIMRIAEKHNLKVVEDCACAIGTTYNKRPVGTIGDIGCFSFHPRKAITTGEGGMCTTNHEKLAEAIRQLRNHGGRAEENASEFGRPYYMGKYDMLGFNLRLSDIQAAVGVAQFGKLHMLLKQRRECAEYYTQALAGNQDYTAPAGNDDIYGHTYQSYVVLDKKGRDHRNHIMDMLSEQQIQSRPGTLAVHRLDYYKNKYSINESQFPTAVFCEDQSITLPIYFGMSKEEQDRVIQTLLGE